MEPLAPGTEDEVVDYSSLNKQETENDRLLKLKAVLRNGRYENIFELNYINGREYWFCKVCECPVMGRVYQHEMGRRHSQNMAATSRNVKKEDKDSRDDEALDNPSSRLDIAPGEPVPPGFEGEVARQAQIQERLDGFKVGPLVALEYLIEMLDYDPSKEPTYLCILCDKKGDPRTVLTHLASYNHISQYLQKHFPTCYRALAPYMTKAYKRNWQGVLQKIAEAIEKKFGRLRPFCIDQDKFEKDRMHYLSMISRGKHFSDQNGPTFIELVVHEELTKTFDDEGRLIKSDVASFGGKAFIERDPIKQMAKRSPSPPVVARPTKKIRPTGEEIKKPTDGGKSAVKSPDGGLRIRRRSLSSVSSISSDEAPSKDGKQLARNRSPPVRDFRDAGRKVFDNRERRGFRRRSPSPRRRTTKEDEEERRKNREKEKLQKLEEFSKLSKAIESDVEKTIKQYEKNPEKHPKYNDEWKLFWNRRYKELQAEGKDASKYDFKPEWINFWGKRMRELSDEDLKNRKEGLRKRLGLPEEPTPISFRIGAGASSSNVKSAQPKENRPSLPMAARPDNDPEVILLDDKDVIPMPKKMTMKSSSRNLDRSHSPWESDTSPPRTIKGRRLSRSPGIDSKKIGRSSGRSRERSFERKRSVERRRSPDRNRRSSDRSRRSPDRSRRSPNRLRRSRSRDLSVRKSKDITLRRSRGRSRDSRDRRSRSPDSYKTSREFSREKDYFRDRELDLPSGSFSSMDRNWDRGLRESSFERDVRGRERIRTVAELPWEREKLMYGHSSSRMMPHEDFYAPPPIMRDVSRQPPQLNFIPPPSPDDSPDDEVNIVSVLRLLTALEEKLGSLGPKIIDLLAQALALEKKEANSSETLLDNEINCVMFETVKEKLKGQLMAGLVDPMQERAFKKAIHKTANLIHLASQRKKGREVPNQSAVAVPGVGAVDKAAIAKQLANALVAQGKTDVTQGELEQLINAVVGMAEASKNSNKPMSTASFLSQLTGGANRSSPEVSKEKVIIARIKPKEEKREKPKAKDPLADLEGLTEPLSPGTPEKSTTSNMENLSDSDLQTLLQNFKDLSTEEQMNLINYLKKLELDEPERVERLRKFVNLDSDKASKEVIDLDKESSPDRNGRKSPFSSRIEEVNPDSDSFEKRKKDDKIVHLDSEDEDYSFEDVVKAASKNVKQKEMEDSRKIVEDSIVYSTAHQATTLTDAKTLISNLMGSISGSNVSSSVNLLGLSTSNTTTTSSNIINTPTSSADFAKAFSSINMDSLASIVSNVQKATQDKKMNFEPPPMENRDRFSEKAGLPRDMSFEPPRGIIQNQSMGGSMGIRDPLQSMNIALGRIGQARPLQAGLLGSGPGGQNMPVNIGPRPQQFSQRGPIPNQFGNSNFMNQQRPVRPQFNPNFNNPRFGAPRGPVFNNRW